MLGAERMIRERVRLGCEVLLENPPAWFRSGRLGLLANQASVTPAFEHVRTLIHKSGGRLCRLFSPQHGFYGEKQANMQESAHGWDSVLDIPVFSLYGSERQPTPEMLESMDVLLIDLQDIGTRVYTYGATVGLCLESVNKTGIKVVILDRPNPINGIRFEGNLLKENCRSFVGLYPIPMRHGLTLGELGRYIVAELNLSCDLEVIPMKGWNREDFFSDTRLPWIFPSPNVPSWETSLLYPGMVLLEGTNVSEGRGTTLPFHLFGAPFVNQRELIRFLKDSELEGVVFRPVCFEPVFDKWKGETCYGFQIHITDPKRFRPYRLGLTLIQAFCRIHEDHFRWLPPPYEYEEKKLPIDILLGEESLRKKIEEGRSVRDLEKGWKEELRSYIKKVEDCFIYPPK